MENVTTNKEKYLAVILDNKTKELVFSKEYIEKCDVTRVMQDYEFEISPKEIETEKTFMVISDVKLQEDKDNGDNVEFVAKIKADIKGDDTQKDLDLTLIVQSLIVPYSY